MCLVKAGSARTLYLDEGLWQRIQRLVKMGYARNASQLVNRVLAEALGRLENSNVPEDLAYEELDLERLSNIDAIVPKLLWKWKGRRGALHLFITLIEKVREKKQIESQLEKYRLLLKKKGLTNS